MQLDKLNSMTKYPSILTYHAMGERGILRDKVDIPFDGPALLTEKVDGTNARIILWPDGFYIIGMREELLYAKGDLIINPTLAIVATLKPLAEAMVPSDVLTVYYLEVYGWSVGKNGKQYTGSKTTGCRLFDVATFPNHEKILEMPIEKIASWREHGGQMFCDEEDLHAMAYSQHLLVTPRIGLGLIPSSLRETYDWMNATISMSQAKSDSGAMGRPEGIVVRTPERSRIAKLRFEDYEKTFRVMEAA